MLLLRRPKQRSRAEFDSSPFFFATLSGGGESQSEALAEAQMRLTGYLKARLGDESQLFREKPGDTELDRLLDVAWRRLRPDR